MSVQKKEIIVESFSNKTLGIKGIEGTWYNIDKEISEKLKKVIELNIAKIKKGDKIRISGDLEGQGYNIIELLEQSKETRNGNLKIVNIKGKDFVTYSGLLGLAHKNGLENFEILEQFVNEDMTKAWVKVRAYFNDEKHGRQYFDGIGSSTPENTGDMTKTHPVEMAHTRAKSRCLRDALNVGKVAIEELKQDKD